LGLWLCAGPAAAADLSREEVRELEGHLAFLGFDPGPIDGVADWRTELAIRGYQSFAALHVDGVASPALLEELRGVAGSLEETDQNAPAESAPVADAGPTAPDDESSRTSQADVPLPSSPAEPVGGAAAGLAVHLASFHHEDKAREEWQRLQRKLPNLLSDMVPSIEPIDLGEEGIYFRLYARPFPNEATAEDFCITIHLEGYNCRVTNGEIRQTAAAKPAAETVPNASSGDAAQSQPDTDAAGEAEDRSEEPVVPATKEFGAAALKVDPVAPEAEPASQEQEQPAAMAAEQSVASLPPAAPAEPTGSEPPSAPEEIAAAAPQTGTAATDEHAATEPSTDGMTAIAPPAETLGEATTAPVSGNGAGAPTALVPVDQTDQPVPGRVGMEVAVGGRSGSAVGAPTVLIVADRFTGAAAAEPEAPQSVLAGSAEMAALNEDMGFADTAMTNGAGPPVATTQAPPAAPVETAAEPLQLVETQTAALSEAGADVYTKATTAFEAGDCAAALRYYGEAFEKGGLSRQALASGYNNRGRCLFERARYDEALDDLDHAIALDQEFAAAFYNRGRVHNALGESSQAEADLDRAFDLGFGRLGAQP
jgi:peptidoglycan hydrolase-like protein with peptidoglycan-binding domain